MNENREPWPEDRRAELDRLDTLLREVRAINSGSHCLERIQRCIAMAEELLGDDIARLRLGLMTWMKQQSRGEGA